MRGSDEKSGAPFNHIGFRQRVKASRSLRQIRQSRHIQKIPGQVLAGMEAELDAGCAAKVGTTIARRAPRHSATSSRRFRTLALNSKDFEKHIPQPCP